MTESVHIFRLRHYNDYNQDVHLPTHPVDRDKAKAELTLNIKKATSPEESAQNRNMSAVSSKLYSALGAASWTHASHLSNHSHIMHHLYLVLPLVCIHMNWPQSTTHPR